MVYEFALILLLSMPVQSGSMGAVVPCSFAGGPRACVCVRVWITITSRFCA